MSKLALIGIILLFVLTSTRVFSQTVISGTITDNKNKPLIGASISLKDSYDGAVSDSSGHFQFLTEETGTQTLEATLIGYSTYSNSINISGDSLKININLKELVTELKAVVLMAGTFEAGDQKKGAVLNAIDIVTTAGANGSVTGALNTLPGTQNVGESTGLFVRGGSAVESKIYFDGNLINNFYYSSLPGMASRGRFNPFLFKGTIFSTGGYSALYGQALSSALILESTDLPEKTEGNIAVSVIGVGAGIQKLTKNKKSAWGITYNYTNLGLAFKVIKQKDEFFTAPENHTADANFRIKTKRGFIKYYGYFSTDKVGFRENDIDSAELKNAFSLKNVNTFQNITWKEFLGSGWRLQMGLSYSYNRDIINNKLQNDKNETQNIISPAIFSYKNYGLSSPSNYSQIRFVLEKKQKGLNAFRFGAEEFYSSEKYNYTSYDGGVYTKNPEEFLTAIFAEKDFYISNNLAVKAGLRAENSKLLNKWNLAERLSLAYKFEDNSQASFAFGTFYQNPEIENVSQPVEIGFAKATHYILQYQKSKGSTIFRTEAFYKKYNNLFKTANGGTDYVSNNGFGYARGIEIFYRNKGAMFKNIDYWVSYSFLDTKRDFLNFPFEFTPSFAAKHTASLVLKKFVLPIKTGFNASYTYSSGRPFYNITYSGGNSRLLEYGKTIDYHSLNFSMNYLPALGKKDSKTFGIWVLSVSNIIGIKHIYGYNFSAYSGRKVAILPPSKTFVYLGYFMSFGIDRTEDVINNNL